MFSFELYEVPTRLWRWNRQSVPKRWLLNSTRRRTIQNKIYEFKTQRNSEIKNYPPLWGGSCTYFLCDKSKEKKACGYFIWKFQGTNGVSTSSSYWYTAVTYHTVRGKTVSLGFPHQNPAYTTPIPTRATRPAHLILLDFITRTILSEEYRSFREITHHHTIYIYVYIYICNYNN
jgi:hypothetical protein